MQNDIQATSPFRQKLQLFNLLYSKWVFSKKRTVILISRTVILMRREQQFSFLEHLFSQPRTAVILD